MGLPALAAAVVAVLVLGYRFYGRFVARQFALDDGTVTPAHRKADGVDFVPTRPFYLFGQHFSAIAAAGPIVGPILACQQFGWLPCLLWIGFGVVFIGAVHDVSALVASVRHDARSIAEVVKVQLGRRAWLAILAFIWLALIYVIVAFVDITAGTFVSGDADAAGLTFRFNQGGAVALAAMLYLGLALVMGALDRLWKPPLWLMTIVFVPATLFVVWFGTQHSTWIILTWRQWTVLIMGYCAVASVTPMWLLMQPRGYLGGFVLYGALLVGVIGIFFGGYDIQQPAWKGLSTGGETGALFPFLFVTIACGACSGFHGLVCSGTTSKQIDRETHCHPIGYGAMLLEAFVALIALATVMIVSGKGAKLGPNAIYSQGLGRFITIVIGDTPQKRVIATTFGAMALSTFIFDTLDSATRLGRYVLQELFGSDGKVAAVIATLATCLVPLGFLVFGSSGRFHLFWTLFGTSNQLLAALTLLAISVWLYRGGGRRPGKVPWFTVIPMTLVLAVTVTSLALQARGLFTAAAGSTPWANGLVSVILLALAATLVGYGVQVVRRRGAVVDAMSREDVALTAAGILIVTVGNDGVIRGATPASTTLLGVPPHELIGRPLGNCLFADHAQLAHHELLRGSAASVTTTWRWRTRGGELRPLLATWQRSPDGWTGVVTRAAADRTIDEQLDALDRAQRHLDDAQRLARLGSWTLELATGRVGWSSMMYELHDYDRTRPPPTNAAEYGLLVHPSDVAEMVETAQAAIRSGDTTEAVYRVRRAGGGWRHLRARMSCERDDRGQPTILTGGVQDVSDDHVARSELIADRERAQNEASAKTRFLAQVTHELRTPLAGVIGMIDLAIGDGNATSRGEHLTSARASARHLLELIDDLLDASREDSWQINVVAIDFDLRDVIAQAMAMVSPRARKKGLSLRGELADDLTTARRGDPLRLRQILVNLLYNAVKYTPAGHVVATARPGDGDTVIFTVTDTGVGIEPDQQAAVFEPFVQADDAAEGVGLGLAITRELVTALHGTIHLQSAVGVGTEITVTLQLPLGHGPTTDRLRAIDPGSTPAAPWATGGRALRILLAEDHPTNAAIAQAILERSGHSTLWVADGEAAVAAVAAERFDVILMDLEMPRLDGAGATRRIRQREHRERAPRLPIIAVSAHRDGELTAATAGMDDYLGKPVDAIHLADLLYRIGEGELRAPIDHAARLAKVGGRTELAATIAETFLAHLPSLTDAIDAALQTRNLGDLHRAAHGLRGALLMVAATDATALADQLERGTLEEAPRLRARLVTELARVGAELSVVV